MWTHHVASEGKDFICNEHMWHKPQMFCTRERFVLWYAKAALTESSSKCWNSQCTTITTSAISPNIHHLEAIPSINNSKENNWEGAFVVKVKGTAGGRGLDHYVLAIYCPNTVREIPHPLEISCGFSPAFPVRLWHVFFHKVVPYGFTHIFYDAYNCRVTHAITEGDGLKRICICNKCTFIYLVCVKYV